MANAFEVKDDSETGSIHPPINTLLDALSFRLARLVAMNDQIGTVVFKERHGLTLNEWRVLGLTHAIPQVTVARIRKILFMDRGLLSRTVKALKERDLIASSPSTKDARAIELVLTEQGSALHNQILEFTARRNELMVEPLSVEECTELARLVQKITLHNEALSELWAVLR